MQKRGAGNRRKLAGFTAAMAVSCTIVFGTGGTAWAASAGEGRGYALEVKAGVSLVDLGLDIPLVDTGLQSAPPAFNVSGKMRSEEHTSELQSQSNLVCRLLLEKKKELHMRDCT